MGQPVTKELHGHCSGGTPKAYSCWQHMKRRCLSKNDPAYKNYGGRGIKVCDRWLKFSNFYADMGDRPDGLSLDRIDNDGNYEPGNCRWATRKEQNRNTRRNRHITYKGETKILIEWVEHFGIYKSIITDRLNKGRALDEVFSKKKLGKRKPQDLLGE